MSIVFALFDFELIDVLPQETHGGSIRYIVGRKNKHKISSRVNKGLGSEKDKKLDDLSSCLKFKKNCENSRKKVTESLTRLKNEGKKMDESELFVSQVKVDSGRMLKRVQPAPQGRAHRIRKRSNHVTLVVDSRNTDNN